MHCSRHKETQPKRSALASGDELLIAGLMVLTLSKSSHNVKKWPPFYLYPHKKRFNLTPEKEQRPKFVLLSGVCRTKPDPKDQEDSEEQTTVSVRCLTPGLR